MANIKWEEKARAIQREDKYELKSLPGGWVTRRKYSVEVQEKMVSMFGGETFVTEEGLQKRTLKAGELTEFHKLVLLNGVLDHNFADENDEAIEWNENFVTKLMRDYPEIELEIMNAITEFNRPLAGTSSTTSGTPPSGTSPEPSSSQE